MNQQTHPQQLTKTEALSLCSLSSRIPCLSPPLQGLKPAGLSSVLAAVSYKAVPSRAHTNCFPAQEKYPREHALVIEIHTGWGEDQCSCNC